MGKTLIALLKNGDFTVFITIKISYRSVI